MAYLISRHQIPLKVRRLHAERYKRDLRKSLLNPTLSNEQRDYIKMKLAEVDKPKSYRSDAPPPPGAIDPRVQTVLPSSEPTVSVPETVTLYPDEKKLLRLRKPQLLVVGLKERVALLQDSMTKPQLTAAILSNRQNRGWV